MFVKTNNITMNERKMKYYILFAFSALTLFLMSQPLLAGKTYLPAFDDLIFDQGKHQWTGKTRGQYTFQLHDENRVSEDDFPVDLEQVQVRPGFFLHFTTKGRTIKLVTKRGEGFSDDCHLGHVENGRMVVICP